MVRFSLFLFGRPRLEDPFIYPPWKSVQSQIPEIQRAHTSSTIHFAVHRIRNLTNDKPFILHHDPFADRLSFNYCSSFNRWIQQPALFVSLSRERLVFEFV